jgi:hypothetical protein
MNGKTALIDDGAGRTRSGKVPDRTKQPRGNVKSAIALRKAGLCEGNQTRRFCVDVDNATSRRDLVDPRYFAIAAVARIARLDSSDFGLGGCCKKLKVFSRFSTQVNSTI